MMSPLFETAFKKAEEELKILGIDIEVDKNHTGTYKDTVAVYLKPIAIKGKKSTIELLKSNGWWSTYTSNTSPRTKQFRKDITV